MTKIRYSEEPSYDKEWIDECKVICSAAGWHLIGTKEWDEQYVCHERTGKILKVQPDWNSEGALWDAALNAILDRSYRS